MRVYSYQIASKLIRNICLIVAFIGTFFLMVTADNVKINSDKGLDSMQNDFLTINNKSFSFYNESDDKSLFAVTPFKQCPSLPPQKDSKSNLSHNVTTHVSSSSLNSNTRVHPEVLKFKINKALFDL